MADTLKPFLVEMTYSAVVLAEDARSAQFLAECKASEIVNDSGGADELDATELRSLAHLKRLAPHWDRDCCAYGGDQSRLFEVLPEEDPPERDDKTIDMFGRA